MTQAELSPDWEVRAMESVRDFCTQLQAAMRERDLGRKFAALDGMVRQCNSWMDLLNEKEQKGE